MSASICEILHLTRASADVVLSTLRIAVYTVPIPGLSHAAKIALDMLDIVEAKQNAQLELNSLTRDCCGIVYAITVKYTPMFTADISSPGLASISNAVTDVASHLSIIKTFVHKEANRLYFSRVVKRSSRARKAAFYHKVLECSLPNLQIHSMCIQTALAQAPRQNASQQPHAETPSQDEDRISRRRLEIEREERELEERQRKLREREERELEEHHRRLRERQQRYKRGAILKHITSPSSGLGNGGFFERSRNFNVNGGKFYDVRGDVNTTKNINPQHNINSGNSYWSFGGNSLGGLTPSFSPLSIASAHHGAISAGI
ncbi:hypothetical protein BD779DRAFT_1541455 [Infundibulicybe gibba]|nr:hypothetical protein BD779DRAFT_1541455 [Infundibulicybe gibba]